MCEVEITKAKKNVDFILSFVNFIYTAQGSWRYKLLYKPEEIAGLHIYEFGQTCGFYLKIETQHLHIYRKNKNVPFDEGNAITFYREPQPSTPTDVFTNLVEEFPLRDSRVERDCRACYGSGRNSDGRCWICNGKGEVIEYTEMIYKFSSDIIEKGPVIAESINHGSIPQKLKGMKSKMASYFFLKDFTGQALERHIDANEQTYFTLSRAENVYKDIQADIIKPKLLSMEQMMMNMGKKVSHDVLFQRVERRLFPINFVNTATRSSYGQFWTIGTNRLNQTIWPPMRLDALKVLTGLGLTTNTALLLYPVFTNQLILPFLFLSLLYIPLIALIGLRIYQHQQYKDDALMTIIGSNESRKAQLFALLAYVSSYKGVGYILDPFYPKLFDFLLGNNLSSELSTTYCFYFQESHQTMRVLDMAGDSVREETKESVTLLKKTNRLLVIVESEDIAAIDAQLVKVLQQISSLTIYLVFDQDAPVSEYWLEAFSQSQDYLKHHTVRCLNLDISQATRQYLEGSLGSDDTQKILDLLQIDSQVKMEAHA